MSALMAVAALLATQSSFEPTGPKILVTLDNAKSFVIAADKKGSPKTVEGILKLVRSGFYNGQRFHRVESWLVQWGDPKSKTLQMGDPILGGSGSGQALPFEGPKAPFQRGVVGVASTGTGVGGDSQLFVLTKDALQLNGGYAVFGKVISGMSVVDHIKVGDRIASVRIASQK